VTSSIICSSNSFSSVSVLIYGKDGPRSSLTPTPMHLRGSPLVQPRSSSILASMDRLSSMKTRSSPAAQSQPVALTRCRWIRAEQRAEAVLRSPFGIYPRGRPENLVIYARDHSVVLDPLSGGRWRRRSCVRCNGVIDPSVRPSGCAPPPSVVGPGARKQAWARPIDGDPPRDTD
jgi:hypothetical protein